MGLLNSLGFLAEVLVIVVLGVPLILGGLFVILVVANRADPDHTGRRPTVIYLFATSFVTLFITLFATYLIATKLFGLIGRRISTGNSLHPIGDAAARGSVIGVLIALATGAALYIHLRAATTISSAEEERTSPIGRIHASYLAAVSFVCVVIVIAAGVAAVYQLFPIAAPGVFAPGHGRSRVAPLRALFPAVYLAVAAAAVLRAHWRAAPTALRPPWAPLVRQLPSVPTVPQPLVGSDSAVPPAGPGRPAPRKRPSRPRSPS